MQRTARGVALVSALARSEALPIGIALGLLAAGAWLGQVSVLNHDVGWLLVGTRRLLEGAALYVDGFVDVNPPGFLYWMAPAVLASRGAGVAVTQAYPAYVALWSLASLALCARLLYARFGAESAPARGWLLALLAFLFAIWPAASSSVLPVHAIGQREHQVVLLLTPLVLLAAIRADAGRVAPRVAALAGALAGIALCAKPQYLVCVAALELWLRVRRRAWRPLATPELAALTGVGALYLASIALVTPAYVSHALPLALDTYWAYQHPAAELVTRADLLWLAGAAAARFLARRRPQVSALCDGFGVATASAYAAFLLGGTGWPYHALPFRSFALATVGCALLPWPARARGAALPWPAAIAALVTSAALAGFAVSLLPWNIGRTFRVDAGWRQFSVGRWQDLLDHYAPGGPLLAFSSGIPPAFPLVDYADVAWSSRFSCQWILPALVRARAGAAARPGLTPARLDALEHWLMDAVVADLETTPPGLVLVDTRPDKPAFAGLPFDFLAWFSRDARFRRIWSGYQRVATLDGLDVYARASGTSAPVR